MANGVQSQIIELMKRSEKILILPSSPPDGDSLGSAIALYLAFKKLEKHATVVCSDPVPDVLQFLPNTKIVGDKMITGSDFIITLDCKNAKVNTIKSTIQENKVNIIISPREGTFSAKDISFNKAQIDYDLIITVDTAELSQLRGFYENNIELFHEIPVINIDHHVSNGHFGKINYVDIMASSTTEMLVPLLEKLGQETNTALIDENMATLLLTGIITDTGSFQNANTTPKSFAKAAQLISYGARQQEIIQHVYKTKQLSQLKLWGRVLSKIQTDEKHRIVWSTVSKQDFKDTQSQEEQTGDIIDELMTNAPGAEVVMLLKERKDGSISVSIRTTSAAVDGAKIAENFGGGGHTQAAGFRMENTTLHDAEHKIIEYVQNFQAQRLGIIEAKSKPTETYDKPMIDVQELIKRANEAQKATDLIHKAEEKHEEKMKKTSKIKKSPKPVEQFNPKPPEETPKTEIIYKFED